MNPTTETPDTVLVQVLQLFSQERHDEAWRALNEGVRQYPADARLRFLLGSVLAGQQQYTQALSQLEYAVQLDPNFEIARFQLGSLRFTSGDAEGARLAWGPLAALPDTHYLKCFKNGCEALMEDRFADTVQWLREGIAANTENLHLNNDMQLLVDRTLELIQSNQEAAAGDGSTHLLISGYQANAPQDQESDDAVDPTHHTRH